AAGGARLRLHRVLRPGGTGRVRRDRTHLHGPDASAHRGLHHREIRMSFETHRHFHDELSAVKVRLLTMSGEAEAALGLAVEALLERDADKARQVIANDRAIDNME